MAAELLLFERHILGEAAFVELRIWKVPRPVRGSSHDLKYSLALVENGICVVRFDNEAGKGDHLHVGDEEIGYAFKSADMLLADFWRTVDRWRDG